MIIKNEKPAPPTKEYLVAIAQQQAAKRLLWLSRVSTLAGIIGAAMVACNAREGYWLFLISSAGWLWVASKREDVELALINLAFLVCNLLGLWNLIKGA